MIMLLFLIIIHTVVARNEPRTEFFREHFSEDRSIFYTILPFAPREACEVVSESELREFFPTRTKGKVIGHIVGNISIRGNVAAVNPTWYKQLEGHRWADGEKEVIYGTLYTQALFYTKTCDAPTGYVAVFSAFVLLSYVVLGVLFVRWTN
jgi:hypothetical protein